MPESSLPHFMKVGGCALCMRVRREIEIQIFIWNDCRVGIGIYVVLEVK